MRSTKAESAAAVARCVILVPATQAIEPACEEALLQLEDRGYCVRRVSNIVETWMLRCQMATKAFNDGFEEMFWIDPNIVFHPDDVQRLRNHRESLVCGLYPIPNRRQFACEFLPTTREITFGAEGGVTEIVSCSFGFVYTHRRVYETVERELKLALSEADAGITFRPFFQPIAVSQHSDRVRYLPHDYSFCSRARQCGFKILADTSIRLSAIGRYRFSWEDAGSDRERFTTYHVSLPSQSIMPASEPVANEPPPLHSAPRNPLQGVARPLHPAFPRFCACAVTYQGNLASMELTRANFLASDWGQELHTFVQPPEWPISLESAARNYRRALEFAAKSGADFALILEDDVRVCRALRQNLLSIPLVQRDQCDFLGLYVPDTLQSPWERQEAELGYRLARPLYSGPDKMWHKYRLWGSQAYVLSRRLILACLERWNRLTKGNDSRVIFVCSELRLPMWYSAPCLVQHAPLKSAHATPHAHAPDFEPDFLFTLKPGYQPPEGIPGWQTIEEGRLLYKMAERRDVLELGTSLGRSTISLAQHARTVVSVDTSDPMEAMEWARRYEVADRVDFHTGTPSVVCDRLKGRRFGLAVINRRNAGESISNDVQSVLPLVQNGGLIAFHNYPDPEWPQVREVVDDFADRLGWTRLAQADYLGVFRIGSS